jgi:Flp pilus assembly secretin CpaC
MKISNSIKRSLFIAFSIFSVTNLFAGDIIIIRRDPGSEPPSASNKLKAIIPVTATEDNSELAVYFEEAVGDATITVYDASSQVVYQEVIDTDSQSAAFIDISTWASGDYTLTISYGTTNLIGEFTIE